MTKYLEHAGILTCGDVSGGEYSVLEGILRGEGLSALSMAAPEAALDAVFRQSVDCLILIGNDREFRYDHLLAGALSVNPWLPVIFIQDHPDDRMLHHMTRLGLFDHLGPDTLSAELLTTLAAVDAYLQNLRSFPDDLRHHLHPQGFGPLIGNSPAMQEIYQLLVKLMNHDITVAIYGASGTGKEIVARLLHHHSLRQKGKFVTLNCAAVPENLLESELFGHQKGAFTGAVNDRVGKFEYAHGGTLFLDEIGELSLPLQAKLLRIIEQGHFERVGSNESVKADVRLITATNRDLEKEAEKGNFRQDLLFRINVFPVHLPPLSRRHHDALLLSHRFVQRFSGKRIRGLSESMRRHILSSPWEGNVRQLENALTRLSVLADSPVLQWNSGESTEPDLAKNSSQTGPFALEKLSEIESWQIDRMMSRSGGNISEAARRLGISRVALYRKLGRMENADGAEAED